MIYDYEFLFRIAAPRPTVFERLLRIEHLARWFCGWSRIEPRVGGRFQFGGETCLILPEGDRWETMIEEGEALRRFSFAWPIQGAPSRVSYRLEDEGSEATLLRVRHTGVPIRDSTCGTVHDAWRLCLSNLKSIAEGRSDTVRPDHSPILSTDMKLSVLIEAPPDRIFRALIEPEQVDHWSTGGLPQGRSRVEPAPGGDFLLEEEGERGRLVDIDPPHRLRILRPQPHADRTLEALLEAKASGTALYLTIRGYRPGEEREILRDRGRWSDLLVCLKNYIEGGDSGFRNAYRDQFRECSS